VLTKPESYSLQFNGPKLEFTIMQAGTRRRLQAATGAIVAGSRYHVVGTYDGSTQRLYINGTQVASAALTGAITTNTNQLNIASWNGSSEFLAGTVDEPAVYAAVLSPTQVANHYSVGTNPTTTQSQLTVSRSGTGTGTVTSAPAGINCGTTCAATFNNGTSITLSAAPASGSVFAGWSGGGCSGTAGCTLTLNANTTVTATFNPAPSTLTVTRNGTGSGNVTSAPAGINCGATCAASFAAGTSVTLTAAPATGSVFSGWSGGACSGTAGCTLTLNANTTVTATFDTGPQATLTVTPAGTGSGTVTSAPAGINCGVTCAASFTQGASVTLTAAAAVGSAFAGWSGGGCSGTGTCTLTLNADTTVTPTFDTIPPSTLTVTPAGTGSGTVTSAPAGINCGATCASPFAHGTSITLTAAAASGSVFAGWSGGGCSSTGTCTLTLNADTTVTGTFNPAPPPSSYPQVVKADGPVGYWRLGELSGTTAADSAGTGVNPGTYQGAVTHGVASLLPSDSVDKATAFSGATQYVRVASSASLSLASTVSLEAWIKPVSIPAAGAFASVLTKPESYSLQFNGPKLEFNIMQAGTRRRLQAATGAIVAGSVYHVVGTYDGTTQRLYINGTQVASAALTGAITTNTNQLNIASWNGSSEFLAGTVDEAAVYPTVLSPTKIANHYATGTTVTTAASSSVSGTPAAITLAGSSPVATGVDDTLGRIYVTRNHGEGLRASNGVTVIDAATHGIVAEITTGRWGPSSLAVDPVRHLVYVTSATWGSTNDHSVVVVIDGRTNRIVRRIAVGPGPKSIAVNAKTNRVYVTDQNGMDAGQALAVIDGATGRTIGVIPMGPYARYYENPLGLAVDTRSNTVYATNPLEGTLYIVDGATNTVRRSLALGDEPTAVAVDSATGRAFIAHAGRGSTKVSVIDGRTAAVVKSIRVAGSPRGVAVDPQGGTAYVTTAGHGTAAIDTATAQVADLLDCGPGAYGVTVSTTGTVIVADRTDEILCVLPRRARTPTS
jgi:YVTN family beta-propeller protein